MDIRIILYSTIGFCLFLVITVMVMVATAWRRNLSEKKRRQDRMVQQAKENQLLETLVGEKDKLIRAYRNEWES